MSGRVILGGVGGMCVGVFVNCNQQEYDVRAIPKKVYYIHCQLINPRPSFTQHHIQRRIYTHTPRRRVPNTTQGTLENTQRTTKTLDTTTEML